MFPKFPVRVLIGALFCSLIHSGVKAEDEPVAEEVSADAPAFADEAVPGPVDPYQSDSAGVVLPSSAVGDLSPAPGLKVDLTGAGSYIYDSNTSQSATGTSASMFAFTYGANVKLNDPQAYGSYFGVDYVGQYFLYADSSDDLGRDPFEQAIGSYVGVNGAKTRLRLDLDYRANNGNSFNFDNVYRETRRAASDDYTFRFGASRDLFRGSLEFGAGYSLRDFDAASGLTDGENTYGDIAWLATPSFAPKSDMGLGLRFGSDDYDGQSPQDFVTPSYRWRYRLSGKTTINNSFGYEFRSYDGVGARETENFVYDGGIEWLITPKTGIGVAYYRRVQPSFILNGEDVTTTGVSLNLTNRLPLRFVLNTRVGLENAEYFPGAGGVPTGREDDFFKMALDLSHPLQITERIRGEWAVFFHHNQNDSTIGSVEFDQNVAGVRVGLVY